MRLDLLNAQDQVDTLQEQVDKYCGEHCYKRPMQIGCVKCPFYSEADMKKLRFLESCIPKEEKEC
jgi:hypothetical protein